MRITDTILNMGRKLLDRLTPKVDCCLAMVLVAGCVVLLDRSRRRELDRIADMARNMDVSLTEST
jgi:predicted lysophospholipase L1 biosynthesis ABC-type transport system permease subunit